MNHQERIRGTRKSTLRLGFFVAFAFAAWYGLLSIGHMSRFADLASPFSKGWNHVEGIIHSSGKFEKTPRDLIADELRQALRENRSLIGLAQKALDVIVEGCDHLYENSACDGFVEDLHCATRKVVYGTCIYWRDLKESNVTIDPYTARVILDEAYGLDNNGTHVTSVEEARFGTAQYSLRQMEMIDAMDREFVKIQRHAILLANMMRNMTAIGVYTKSFDDFVSVHTGGYLKAGKSLYVVMGIVGAPIPFVGYYIFCTLVEYYDFAPNRAVTTVDGITTMHNIFGEKAWAAMLRLFYIDLWELLPLEIVVFIMSYYMEYFSPLYWFLKKSGRGFYLWMEKHQDVYDTFSAFPAFVLGFLSAFRFMCCGIIIASMGARIFVLSVVVAATTLKILLTFGTMGFGAIASISTFIRSRSGSLTFLVTLGFLIAEIYAGAEVRSVGELIPSDMGEFSLKNWLMMVPGILRNAYKSMPPSVFTGILSLFGFVMTDVVKRGAKNVIDMNESMQYYQGTGQKLHGMFRLACGVESAASWAIFIAQGAFWLVTIASPFIGKIEGAKTIFGGVFATENWLFYFAKMSLKYLSQRA